MLQDELEARVNELEELLYAARLDIERDGLFEKVHSYKTLSRNLLTLSRSTPVLGRTPSLPGMFDELDEAHRALLALLTQITSLAAGPVLLPANPALLRGEGDVVNR